jgi:hypothetical protein
LAACASSSPAPQAPTNQKTVVVDAPIRAATPSSAPASNSTSGQAAQSSTPVALPSGALVNRPSSPAPTAPSAPTSTPAPAASTSAAYRQPEGLYRCAEGKRVVIKQVSADGRSLGLQFAGKEHRMTQVPTTSGALRYEQARARLAWIITAEKSMLLNMQATQRLADHCKL